MFHRAIGPPPRPPSSRFVKVTRYLAGTAVAAVLTTLWLVPSLRGTQDEEAIHVAAFRSKAEFHFVRI